MADQILPAIDGQTFAQALKAAQEANADGFTDPETGVLMHMMPLTPGEPARLPGYMCMAQRARTLRPPTDLTLPAIEGQTFLEALKAAQDAKAAAFHDSETHALIAMIPGTGVPGFWGMLVRAQRLARLAEAERKRNSRWRRILRALLP